MSRNSIPPRVPPRAAPATAAAKPPSVRPPAADEPAPVPTPAPAPNPGDVIEAKAATYYRMTRYLMVVVLFSMAAWFAYDGWKGWPAENAKIDEVNARLADAEKRSDQDAIVLAKSDPNYHKSPHSARDIKLQKVLAGTLPVAGILFLLWALYNSRGSYRLAGRTLSIPGHPPVDLAEIVEIDRSKWDRKGIAYLNYQTAAKAKGRMRLDDFIYDRDPTDEIFKRVEEFVAGAQERPA